jgi:hypothetical protein
MAERTREQEIEHLQNLCGRYASMIVIGSLKIASPRDSMFLLANEDGIVDIAPLAASLRGTQYEFLERGYLETQRKLIELSRG